MCSLCFFPGAGKIRGRYSSAQVDASMSVPGSTSSNTTVCAYRNPSSSGSASIGWYSKPSPQLVTSSA